MIVGTIAAAVFDNAQDTACPRFFMGDFGKFTALAART
jgi:hypothetical protein